MSFQGVQVLLWGNEEFRAIFVLQKYQSAYRSCGGGSGRERWGREDNYKAIKIIKTEEDEGLSQGRDSENAEERMNLKVMQEAE